MIEYITLNDIMLELIKLIFYSNSTVLSYADFKDISFSKVRPLIIKEKCVFQKGQSYETLRMNGKSLSLSMTSEVQISTGHFYNLGLFRGVDHVYH